MSTDKATQGFYGKTLFTLPTGWKIVETPQGWSYEFLDGTHGWPTPRERQMVEAYRAHFDEVVAALERFMPLCSKCNEIATWVSTMSGVRLCATHKTAACREDEDLTAARKALAAVKTDSGNETKGSIRTTDSK